MAYKVIILYQLYMPSYFLGTFTEYPEKNRFSDRSHRTSLTTGKKKGSLFDFLLWALRDSNPRPSGCKPDALNQLS